MRSLQGDFYNRTLVDVPGTHHVVYNGKEDAASDCQNAPVHRLHCWLHCSWPEAEKDDDADVDDRIPVDHGTDDTGAMERSPDKLCTGHIDNVILVVIESGDVATDTAVKQQNGNREVREVNAGHCHGHNILHGGIGTNVNEGKQHSDGHCKDDGKNGQLFRGRNLEEQMLDHARLLIDREVLT